MVRILSMCSLKMIQVYRNGSLKFHFPSKWLFQESVFRPQRIWVWDLLALNMLTWVCSILRMCKLLPGSWMTSRYNASLYSQKIKVRLSKLKFPDFLHQTWHFKHLVNINLVKKYLPTLSCCNRSAQSGSWVWSNSPCSQNGCTWPRWRQKICFWSKFKPNTLFWLWVV